MCIMLKNLATDLVQKFYTLTKIISQGNLIGGAEIVKSLQELMLHVKVIFVPLVATPHTYQIRVAGNV